jgi:hypothetical protein
MVVLRDGVGERIYSWLSGEWSAENLALVKRERIIMS